MSAQMAHLIKYALGLENAGHTVVEGSPEQGFSATPEIVPVFTAAGGATAQLTAGCR